MTYNFKAVGFAAFSLVAVCFCRPVFAFPTLHSTFSATASAISSIKQLRVALDGTVYVVGTDTAKLVKISADGTTAQNISYDVALPSHSGADFVMDGTTFYIAINGTPRLAKYTISGTTATLVNIITPGTGGTSLSFGPSNNLYNTRSSTINVYDTDLNLTSSSTLSSPPGRSMSDSSGTIYYVSTAGVLRKSTDLTTATDTIIASSLGASVAGVFVSPTGYIYVAHAGTIKKITPAGATLWSKVVTSLAAMSLDSSGRIHWVNTSGVVTVLVPINSLSSLNATPDSTSVELDWVTGVIDSDFAGVTIRRSASGYPTSPTDGVAVAANEVGTTYTDTGLDPETTYYYTVFNETADGFYDGGTTVSATTTADTTPPDAPNISASLATPNGTTINLSWDVPSGTSTFNLQRSVNGGGYSNVQLGIASSTTTYNDTGLSDGTYTYKLFAVDSLGNISNAGTSSTLTVDTTAPAAPSISASLATPNGTTINLSWDAPSGTSTFNLQRSFNGGGYSNVQTGIASSTITYDHTGLSDGTYTYKIFAVDAAGNISNAGTSSTLTVDATAPDAPSISGALATPNGTTINLSWNTPSGTNTFTLQRSFNGGGYSNVQTGIASSTTTYDHTGLSDGTYTYKIFAVDAAGNISNAGTSSTLTVDTTPTAAPTSFTATPDGSTINLSWDNPPVFDFASVTLRRGTDGYPATISSGTAVIQDVTTISYADTGLDEGTYYYSLFAKDTWGNVSTAAQATASVDLTGPETPSEVSAEVSGFTVILTWVNPEDADFDSIVIRRSDTAFPLDVDSDDLVAADVTGTEMEDPDLEPGTYYYSLFALDSSGNVSDAANVTVVNEGITPTVITGETEEVDGSGAVLLGSITDIGTSESVARGFEYGETADYEGLVEETGEFEAEDFALALEDLNCGTTYHYRAYASNETGTAYGEDAVFSTSDCADASDLVLTIEAPTASIPLNSNAVFVVTIANPVDVDIDDVTVVFTLSENLEFVSAEAVESDPSAVSASIKQATLADCMGTNPVSCNLGTIEAGESLTLNVTANAVAEGPLTLGAGVITEGGEASGGSSGATSTASGEAVGEELTTEGSNGGGCSLNQYSSSDSREWVAFGIALMGLFIRFAIAGKYRALISPSAAVSLNSYENPRRRR